MSENCERERVWSGGGSVVYMPVYKPRAAEVCSELGAPGFGALICLLSFEARLHAGSVAASLKLRQRCSVGCGASGCWLPSRGARGALM